MEQKTTHARNARPCAAMYNLNALLTSIDLAEPLSAPLFEPALPIPPLPLQCGSAKNTLHCGSTTKHAASVKVKVRPGPGA